MPITNHNGDGVLGIAAKQGNTMMMRWLVLSAGCRLRELGAKDLCWTALEAFIREESSDRRSSRGGSGGGGNRPKPIPRGTRVNGGWVPKNEEKHKQQQQKGKQQQQQQQQQHLHYHYPQQPPQIAAGGGGAIARVTEDGPHCIEECIVCMERRVDSVLIPCGHICCCKQCVTKFIDCPVCRLPIERVVRTYHVC